MAKKEDNGKRTSAAQGLAQTLKTRIAEGLYPQNAFLPPVRVLAEEFGAGTKTVSEALGILMEEGLTEQTRGRGTRVLPPQDRLSHSLVGVIYATPLQPQAVGTGLIRMIEAAQNTLRSQGYAFEAVNLNHRPMTPEQITARFGAILAGGMIGDETAMVRYEAMGIPFVVANLEWDWNLTGTWVDHRKTTLHAVRSLIRMGHRRIAFIGRSPDSYFYGKARQGYEEGLAEAHIAFDDSLIAETLEHNNLSAYIAAKKLLKANPLPTAVVAARDYHAHGAHHAFSEAGYVVGRDISLIGFDDVTWPEGRDILTTYGEPCEELGSVAAEMLIDRIVHGCRPTERRELECPFILRRSAAPVVSEEAATAK